MVVQEVASGAVLMVAWADREAVERTLASGDAWFWSRSRQELWRKGATSGHVLSVVEVRADCDGDTLLYRVDAAGPACHRGTRTCFDPVAEKPDVNRSTRGENPAPGGGGPRLELGWLWDVLEMRREAPPAESYTARLLAAGIDRIARKVGEEATETVIAALRAAEAPAPTGSGETSAPPPLDALTGEAADLLYHLLVLLMAAGGTPDAVAAELRRRHAAPRPVSAAKPEDPPLAESVDVDPGEPS